jgi:hypothetical protein
MRLPIPCLPALLCLALPAAAAEDYSLWAHSAELWTNTSPDGAYVVAAVKRFPLLVRLDSAHFDFSQARGRGQDLRAAGLDGRPLPYQIDRWDSAGKRAEIWVLVDSVAGNSWSKALKLYWGKADAEDSSRGATVFDSADGWSAVWHLGAADTLPRPNAVAGGNPATPFRYDGDEARAGVIGLADSLDGAANGDYLDLGSGYADFRSGLTYSVWARPEDHAFWSRLLDMGNGSNLDNFVLARNLTGEDLIWDQFNGDAANTRVQAHRVFLAGEWQLFTVTVDAAKNARIYRNGELVASETQHDTIAAVTRTLCYIGKSNWPGNDYFKGAIDEPRLSRRARGADWIKLEYANQRPGGPLVSFDGPKPGCQAAFAAPKDTTVDEGALLILQGVADCADGYVWETLSGPTPRILDPERKDLQIAVPRGSKDYVLRYRFSARYGASTSSGEVAVTVREAIPDPAFTLASKSWDGKDSLFLAPKIANLAVIKALRDSVINYAWTVSDVEVDTAWRDSGLLLTYAHAAGTLKVGLCLDNGGAPVCKGATVAISVPSVGILASAPVPSASAPTFDARGRRLKPANRRGAAPPWRRALAVFGF